MTTALGADTAFDAQLAGLPVRDTRPERVAEHPGRVPGRARAQARAAEAAASVALEGPVGDVGGRVPWVLSLAAAVERTLQVLR